MRTMRNRLIMFVLVIASTGAPAAAQLLSERVDGRQRLCLYAPAAGNFLSDVRGQREHRIGLGENCPATFPSRSSDLQMPPTARLLQTRNAGATQSCVYEQGASEWELPAPPSGICPLFAGIGQERRESRQ